MSSPEKNITITSQMHTNDTANGLYAFTYALSVTNSLLSIPLHTYVVWLIVTGARNGLASELLTLNLSMCEIMYSFMALAIPVFPWLITFSILLLFTGRPLFQTCICVERYLAVVHPVLFLKYKPLRYRLVISGLVWLIVLSCSLTSAFKPSGDTVLITVCITGSPSFLVMLFCCLAVLGALKQPQPGEVRRPSERANCAKVKAFKLILFLFLSLLANFIISLGIQFSLNSAGSFLATQFIAPICFFLIISTGLSYPLAYLNTAGKLSCRSALPNTSH